MSIVVARKADKDVDGYLPLARLFWDQYGREGRLIAPIIFGTMELQEPEKIMPVLYGLCGECVSWEDADRLAMDALEPIIRKNPTRWLPELQPWLRDHKNWRRRAAVTIIGRLPMKYPEMTEHCLSLVKPLLADSDQDVKRAVSFAVRVCAKKDIRP